MSEQAKVRIAKLEAEGGLVTEACRVYRAMRRAELPTLDGWRLIASLKDIRQMGVDDDNERRLKALECKQ